MTLLGFTFIRARRLRDLEQQAFDGRRFSTWLSELCWWFPEGHPVQEAAKGILRGERIDALRERILAIKEPSA